MKKKILILGEGRISQAVHYYLKKQRKEAKFLSEFNTYKKIKDFSLLISALPAEEAKRGLEIALEYKKDLLDISDLDPPFYLKKKKDIEKNSILVIPGCGFCPGIINFIIGRELFLNSEINQLFIKTGSLSYKREFFPFLWCFPDLIAEHKLYSWQIIGGKKIKMPPFAGYLEERFLGIPAETYYSVSGFENILEKKEFLNFQFRVIRPLGFRIFFNYLNNYGLFRREKINLLASILQEKKENNLTLAELKFLNPKKETILWKIKSFSYANEKLNSMQKITSLVAVNLAKFILENNISIKGLIFMEELAEDNRIYNFLISSLKEILYIKRKISRG